MNVTGCITHSRHGGASGIAAGHLRPGRKKTSAAGHLKKILPRRGVGAVGGGRPGGAPTDVTAGAPPGARTARRGRAGLLVS